MGIGGWVRNTTSSVTNVVNTVSSNTQSISNQIGSGIQDVINEGDKALGYVNQNNIVKGTNVSIKKIKEHSKNSINVIKSKSNQIGVFSKNIINDPTKLLKHAKNIYGYGKYGFYYTEKYGKLIETNVNGYVLKPIKKTAIMVGKNVEKGFEKMGDALQNGIEQLMKTFEDIAGELTDIFDEFGDMFKDITDNFKKITKVFQEIMDVVKKIQGVVKFGSIFNFLIKIFENKVVELIVLIIHINIFWIKLFILVLSKTGLIYIPIAYFMLNIFNCGYNVLSFLNNFLLQPYIGFSVNYDYYYIGFLAISYFIWYNSKKFMNKIIDLVKKIWKKIKLDEIIVDVVKDLSKELLDLFTNLFKKIKNLI